MELQLRRRAVWADRYAIFDEVASGGMATVYLAARLGNVSGRRVVAVKKLFEQFAKDPDFVAMFLDEARLAAQVQHPNVIRTYQVLRIPASLAIVMELVVGASLVELLRASRTKHVETPLAVAGAILAGVLHGLHAAHEAKDEEGRPFGLVHRDVSPQNVLVGKDGVPRVIDFGIAKAEGRLQVTDVGVRKGKFAYMAPEQIHGRLVDRRADVYAAGLVLWEVLVGRRHHEGISDIAVLSKRAGKAVAADAPSAAGASVSEQVDAVVLRALAVDPDSRFATAEEMAHAVRDAMGVAPPGEVAAWVDRLAHDKIEALDAKVHEVERAFAEGELEEHTRVSRGAPPPEVESDVSVVFEVAEEDVLSTHTAPGRVAHIRAADPVPLELAPTVAESRPISPPARVTVRVQNLAADPSPTRVSPAVLPTAPPSASEPASARSAPDASGTPTAAAGRVKTTLLWMGAVVVVGLAVRALGPSLIRLLVIRGAARRGLALSVESVTLESWELALHQASLRFAEDEDVTLHAPEVRVAVDWLGTPEKVRTREYTLALRGPVPSVAFRFSMWAGASKAPLELDATAGHLVWADAVAPGVGLDAQGLSLAAVVPDRSAADGPTLHAETRSLGVSVRGTLLGPWLATLDVKPDGGKLTIALDPAKPDSPPSIVVTASRTLGRLFSASIPRQKLAQIGVPPTLLGLGPDPELDLSLEGQLFPTGEPLNARMKLALFGVSIAAFSDPAAPSALADVAMEGGVNGSPQKPLRITQGSLNVRGVATAFGGFVTFERGALVVQLQPQAHEPQRGAKPQKAPAPIVFDTRVWTERRSR